MPLAKFQVPAVKHEHIRVLWNKDPKIFFLPIFSQPHAQKELNQLDQNSYWKLPNIENFSLEDEVCKFISLAEPEKYMIQPALPKMWVTNPREIHTQLHSYCKKNCSEDLNLQVRKKYNLDIRKCF